MTPEQRERMRTRILDAARERFLEEGLDGLSMRGIATKVGVSSMTLYLYYDSRQDIIRHIVAEGYGMLNASLDEAMAGDPERVLRRLADAYLSFAMANPCYYSAMFRYLSTTDELCDMVASVSARPVEIIEEALKLMTPSPQGGASERSTAMWCALHGLAQLSIAGQVGADQGVRALDRLVLTAAPSVAA